MWIIPIGPQLHIRPLVLEIYYHPWRPNMTPFDQKVKPFFGAPCQIQVMTLDVQEFCHWLVYIVIGIRTWRKGIGPYWHCTQWGGQIRMWLTIEHYISISFLHSWTSSVETKLCTINKFFLFDLQYPLSCQRECELSHMKVRVQMVDEGMGSSM